MSSNRKLPWDLDWSTSRQLGEGGQGLTYLVSSKSNGNQGVAKRLKYKGRAARLRMCTEVSSLERLSLAGGIVPKVLDSNIAQVNDENVDLYVVMEYISGQTLGKYISSNGIMTIDDATKAVICLLKTVEIAHKVPIAHRDLKPENIMVRDAASHDLVIIDYGLSFNFEDEEVTRLDEAFQNRCYNLPEFVAPSGNKHDLRSDLALLVAIFYVCLTGVNPGQPEDEHGRLPHQRPGCLLSDKHKDKRLILLEPFFNRGFSRKIDYRFQSIQELRLQLDQFLRNEESDELLDPIEIATRITNRFCAFDRKTQLKVLAKKTVEVFKVLKEVPNRYKAKLKHFTFTAHGLAFSNVKLPGLPPGLDLVQRFDDPWRIVVLNHESVILSRYFCVAARGDECVLLAVDIKLRNNQQTSQSDQWESVAWYDNEPDLNDHILQMTDKWLKSSMRKLESELLDND